MPSSQPSHSSMQCSATAASGNRCKLRTTKSEWCWIHLKKLHNLRVKKSNIPNANMGLFVAKNKIKPRSRVVEYTGTTSSEPIQGDYVLEVSSNHFIDAQHPKNTARFANKCTIANKRSGYCRGNNAKFTADRRTNKAYLSALKGIQPNEEVYVDYGRDFVI